MSRRLRRCLFYFGAALFVAGWYWTMAKAIDWAIVTAWGLE